MPYIAARDRARATYEPKTAGELAFSLSSSISYYLAQTPINFNRLSEVLGALEATRVAFEQDVLIPYEADKKQLNGGVF